jgi:hypothetical protein
MNKQRRLWEKPPLFAFWCESRLRIYYDVVLCWDAERRAIMRALLLCLAISPGSAPPFGVAARQTGTMGGEARRQSGREAEVSRLGEF